MIAELERLLTRKRSAPVHASFGNADDDEEEGEILDISFVEEEEEDTGEAPLYPLSNLTKLSAEQETLRHEKWAQEERRRKEEEQRKQREAERKRREEEEKRRKAEDDRREKTAKEKKAKEEKEAIAKAEADRVAKAEAERVAKETKAEEERVAKEREAEEERVAKEREAEEEREAKEREAEEERVANETKKKQEKVKQSAELKRQQLAKRKQKELELLKEFRPWRGGYMRLVHGKDPTPDVHYLHETDDYHIVNAVHKTLRSSVSFEQEVYDENYAVKTREEKEELIELVKGFRFYFTEQIGRFELKVFNGKISHITLTDQLAYVLGHEQEQEIRNEELAKYAVDLGGGVSHLCIYLNSGVIESMIVGNTFANLLQVIAVEGKSGSVVEKDFQSPLFHKIIAREVDVLDVEISTLTGREVPFEFGQVVLTLQFKKQNGGGGPISVFEGAPTFQRGYGYFLGVPRQKGAGVGSVLRNLWRYLRPMVSAARPYAANIAAEIGKEGLETGARVLNEVSKGGSIRDALVSEGKEGAKKLLDKASSSLQKGRGRKKRRGGRKKAEIILKPSDVVGQLFPKKLC
ncbi:hypothetical protein niasHS_011568 [Heterodera schachtii]|uniref:Uncharacterized protein n=1 Tax=Heterodera schachtii TaxID=97005 RepID=A0ABD2IJV4_HETSC